ncbi:hypothetical protein ACR74R_12585 [Mediterraneibacter gnavus]|uniref:hypothetical protein n=1 Tax=Mediterraneibacter gnavus TaxID=33038 RepID=UPI003DA46501
MAKTDKELAVELVLAQIQASSVIKHNQVQTGSVIKSETVANLVTYYYNTLKSLDNKAE